jgi:hypothetical protein
VGLALYRGVSSEITRGISVCWLARLAVHRGVLYQGLTVPDKGPSDKIRHKVK